MLGGFFHDFDAAEISRFVRGLEAIVFLSHNKILKRGYITGEWKKITEAC
jgi:hypothetical protein